MDEQDPDYITELIAYLNAKAIVERKHQQKQGRGSKGSGAGRGTPTDLPLPE